MGLFETLGSKLWIVLAVYLVMNLIVFAMYGIDKYKAVHHKWRIPEATLIGAAVFGVFGALAGMYVIRHKTKKPKFFITVPAIWCWKLRRSFVFVYLRKQ